MVQKNYILFFLNLALLVDGLFANFVGLIFAFGEDGL
jgi:hypothetical protein